MALKIAHVCKWSVIPAVLLFGGCLRAQFIGYTSPQTVTQSVYSAAVCAGPPAAFQVRNIGQSVHYLVYQTSGTVTSLSIQIEGRNDTSSNWQRISDTANTTTSGAVFASIYLNFIRINITSCTGTGTITATYSGTSVATGPPLGLFTSSSSFNKDVSTGRAANASASFTVPLPTGGTGGALYFKFSDGTCAASTLTVTAGPDSTHVVTILPATTLTATGNTQAFTIPALAANIAIVAYTSGCAGSAATYDLSFSMGDRIVTANVSASFSGGATAETSTPAFQCNKSAFIDFTAAGAGSTRILQSVSATQYAYICHLDFTLSTATSVRVISGTGANCATGTNNLTGAYGPNVLTFAGDYQWDSALRSRTVGDDVCLTVGAATDVDGVVIYAER